MYEQHATNMRKCQYVKFSHVIPGCPAGAGKWHISYFSVLLHSKNFSSLTGEVFLSKYRYFKRVSAAARMFRMSIARVMGPTPPGTGVM